MRFASISGRRFAALALASLVAASACKKDEDQEPEVASVSLTVGTATITINSTGVVTGGPITVTRPNSVAISASFKRADGTQDEIAHGADFELQVTSANTGLLTFTRTGAFAGTLAGVAGPAAASTTIAVALFHKVEQHADFGPFNVTVNVQ
jgi:hypothetical protein